MEGSNPPGEAWSVVPPTSVRESNRIRRDLRRQPRPAWPTGEEEPCCWAPSGAARAAAAAVAEVVDYTDIPLIIPPFDPPEVVKPPPPVRRCPSCGTLRELMASGWETVLHQILIHLDSLQSFSVCNSTMRARSLTWATDYIKGKIPLMVETGAGNVTYQEMVEQTMQHYRACRRADPIVQYSLLTKWIGHNIICYAVNERHFHQGPPVLDADRVLHVGVYSTKSAKQCPEVYQEYVTALQWLQNHPIGMFYPRGPRPHVVAMLEAMQELGLHPDTLVLDVCVVRSQWFPPMHLIDCRNVVIVPELSSKEISNEAEVLRIKSKFDTYLQAFRDIPVAVYVLLPTDDAMEVSALVEARIMCFDRMPVMMGSVGNKKYNMIEMLALLAPYYESGFDTTPSVPTIWNRDATGRPCVLVPSPIEDTPLTPGEVLAPTLVVTDATAAVPALVVTEHAALAELLS